jgi:cell division transport system permease protein
VGFRLSYIALEAYRGFRRNLLLAGSMVIIVAISLTLLGVALLASRQIDIYGGFWSDKVEVSVFLTEGVSEPQRAEIQRELETLPVVQSVVYESKEEAFGRFKEQFRDTPDLVNNVTADALPESFRVKLRDPEKFQDIHDRFCVPAQNGVGESCKNGIDLVMDQRQLVERFFLLLRYMRWAFLALALVLGVAAATLIAVTVRVAAFARRKETQIMKLVGASSTYIRLPFLAEGMFSGMLGALIALIFLRVGMHYFAQLPQRLPLFQFMPMVSMREFWPTWFTLLILGVVVSGLASLVALRKYVRV